MEHQKLKVVVIGGVATGPKTAARLRRLNPDAEITIIERGKILSYAGCGMPYYVGGDISESRQLNETPAGVPRDSLFFRNVKGDHGPGPDFGGIDRSSGQNRGYGSSGDRRATKYSI